MQQNYIRRVYGYFTSAIQYTESDLDSDFLRRASTVRDTSKYFYFQSWKPYLIYRRLTELQDGVRVLYIDAGCSMPPIDSLLPFLNRLDDEFGGIQSERRHLGLPVNMDYANCCAAGACISTLKFFGLEDDRNFCYQYPHYENGVMLMINNTSTRNLISEWSETMLNNLPSLYADPKTGLKGFVQNSTDQSVLQAIMYRNGVKVRDETDLCYNTGLYARCRG